MAILLLALLSVACSALTYIQAINWISIVGFVLGISAWVMGRKIRNTRPDAKIANTAMIIGILATFANLFGIVYSFVWGNLMSGGIVVF